jgi:ammonium transporter, Amt family
MELADLVMSLNTTWVLISAALVFIMQAGFGMLEAGFIRQKNTANILMKNFLDFCIASVAFLMFGYAIMFGTGNALFGTNGFFLSGLDATTNGLPLLAFWFFQAVFAGAAATIVAGAMAERTRFGSYLIYSFFLTALIYPLVGHWIWGGGWLAELGFLDFAGSTVVHAVGGFAGLAGALVVGARLGRFKEHKGEKVSFKAHNVPLAALGVFLLWFGWFGFNGGSTLAADATLVSKIIANTSIAASVGAITALALSWWRLKRPDAGMTMNGILAGLVGITAPCAWVGLGASAAIGAVAAVVMFYGVHLLERLKIDDPVGAAPVHGFAGLWGTIAVGIFHEEIGLLATGSFASIGTQMLGAFVSAAFVFVVMYLLFSAIKTLIGLRVTQEVEEMGIDLGEHVVESYPDFAPLVIQEDRSHRIPQESVMEEHNEVDVAV